MTEHETLKTGNAFGQNFKMIWNREMNEVQLYWADGEYSAHGINHWENPQEIADNWYKEILDAHEMKGA